MILLICLYGSRWGLQSCKNVPKPSWSDVLFSRRVVYQLLAVPPSGHCQASTPRFQSGNTHVEHAGATCKFTCRLNVCWKELCTSHPKPFKRNIFLKPFVMGNTDVRSSDLRHAEPAISLSAAHIKKLLCSSPHKKRTRQDPARMVIGVAVVVGSNFSSRRSSRSSSTLTPTSASSHMIEARFPAANSRYNTHPQKSHIPFGNPYKAFYERNPFIACW